MAIGTMIRKTESAMPRMFVSPQRETGSCHLFRPVTICHFCGPLLMLAGVAVSGPLLGQDDPAGFLRRERDLRKISAGNVWLVPAEWRLQSLLGDLDRMQRDIPGLQRGLEESAGQNRLIWETNRQLIDSLRRALSESETDDPKKRKIEQQIRELEKQAVEPRELFAVPDVQRRLIELTNLRLRLMLSVIQIRHLHRELTEAYAHLAEDQAVTDALRRLGADHRTGPLQQGYRTQLKRLEQFERLAATDWLPVYRQSQRIRFGGLLADRVPVNFSWQDSSEPTLVTASMVEAAGLQIPEDAQSVPITVAGRRLTARRIQIPTMRFGAILLTDVPALVLPPAAEDLGASIGPEAFSGHQVELQPDRLRLVIRPL
jgi:hypothetical protein